MERTPLRMRTMPRYSVGEEIFNAVSHGVGAVFGVLATVLCLASALSGDNPYGIVASILYGTTMVLLYATSSIYHGLPGTRMGKRVFQVLDHCSIFVLIAGTYTPYCLCTLRQINPAVGWIYFGMVWGIAALGVILNAIDLKKYEKFSNVCYLALGWCILPHIYTLWGALGTTGFLLLLSGGIAYTVGAVFYVGGSKYPYMHSVFHLFVLLGSVLQFLSVFLFVV